MPRLASLESVPPAAYIPPSIRPRPDAKAPKCEYRSTSESVSNQIRTLGLGPGGSRKSRGGLFLALLGHGVFAAPAAGQEVQETSIDSPYRWIEPGLRLGLFGGYVAAGRGNLEFGPGSTPEFGARFRVRVSSPLSLALGVSYAPAKRWVIDPRLETGPAPVDTVASHWILSTAGVELGLTGARTWHGIHPYVVLGGGLMIGVKNERSDRLVSDAGDEGDGEEGADPEPDPIVESLRFDLGTALSVYGGLGAEIFPSKKLGISFEIRDILLRLKAPGGWFSLAVLEAIETAEAEAPRESQWTHNFELSLTLWYYF